MMLLLYIVSEKQTEEIMFPPGTTGLQYRDQYSNWGGLIGQSNHPSFCHTKAGHKSLDSAGEVRSAVSPRSGSNEKPRMHEE